MQVLCENKSNRNNNRGASLLLVIVTMAFVTIIASVILVITYRNLEAMKNSMNSSQSFYSAEAAMDELKTRFYEWSDKAYCDAYSDWLIKYSTYAEQDREKNFRITYRERLEKEINDNFMIYFGEASEDIDKLFVTFKSDRVSWNDEYTPTLVRNGDDYGITVKDVSLVYKDSADYETIITTDIRLGVHYFGLKDNAVYNMKTDCAEYAIISDGQITNSANSNVNINGNVYAGGYNEADDDFTNAGISFDGGRIDAKSDLIVSKGDIEVNNGAVLKAAPFSNIVNGAGVCNIWTKGFRLDGVGASTMDINGNCYVYDDTTIDAKTYSNGTNPMFKVKGAYYGYNTNNASAHIKDADENELRMGTPEGSSSIVVNSAGSKVDLTGCNPVWISGKTFVSVPKLYGEKDILDTNVSFPEGESIAYRGTQSAYLLPGECIVGIGHNPMSVEEYDRLVNDASVYIDVNKSKKNGGISLAGYVQPDKPYRVATVDYSSAVIEGKVIYLYLNFISSDKATRYFKEYSEKYDNIVDSRMAMLGNGSILFNPDTLVTTGNTLLYDGADSDTEVKVIDNTDTIYDERIETIEAELNSRYNGLINALDENYTGIGMTEFMTENFVNFNKIDGEKSEELDCTGSNGIKYRLITGSDITVNVNTNAIIIASGNVTVAAGANVTGIILAKGNVTLNGAVVNSDPERVAELILNNEKVMPYFDGNSESAETPPNNSVSTSDIVIVDYINWRKN